MTTTEFVAKHRFARLTARKAMRIADLIRGQDVNAAIEILQFTPNRGAAFYMKVVKSAVANASLDENVNVNRLYISECRADVGPLLNDRMRFRPGPQGRAMPFAKRLSHLTVKVRQHEEDGQHEEDVPAREVETVEPEASETKTKSAKASAPAAPKSKTTKSKAAKPEGAVTEPAEKKPAKTKSPKTPNGPKSERKK